MKLTYLALAVATMFIAPGHAMADEYGCKVLLCLADPQGPMTQSECRPPIQRFITGQNKKPADPFPTCPEGAPATMNPTIRPYDACPAETVALAPDTRAVQLDPEMFKLMTAPQQRPGLSIGGQGGLPPSGSLPQGAVVEVGIGEGDVLPDGQKNKVCVGNQLGTLTLVEGTQDLPVFTTVAVYARVATMAPALQPRVVDILIGGKLLRSTRY